MFPRYQVAVINEILLAKGIHETFIVEPRTGFKVVVLLVASGVTPSIYGFGVEEGFINAQMYFGKSERDLVFPNRQEAQALIEMEEKGLICIRR